jgi:enoyl-CoA hydratase
VTVRVEAISNATILTVDRPETKNALDRATAARLGELVREASADPRVRGVVLTGAGADTFVSGGDLKELRALLGEADGSQIVAAMFEALSAIEACDVPVVAAIQGDVLGGGCELMLLCDLVVVERQARLAFRHAKMGLTPAWGGLARLLERCGPLEAARLLYTADRVDAAEALRIGLVNEVVEAGAARRRALELVDRVAENPRAVVAAMKRTLTSVRAAGRAGTHDLERAAFASRWGAPDHEAALRAFFAGARHRS